MSSRDLEILLSSDKQWASERANTALLLSQAYLNNEISEDEYKSLLEDLVRSDVLDQEADDLETKTMLVTAIYAITRAV